ncbi:zinc finger, RING/FYVE/PHD-type containing protein [Tanacetum coccineum]
MVKEPSRLVEIHDVIDREEEESDETKLEFDEEDIMEMKLEFDEEDKDNDDDDVEESEKVEDIKLPEKTSWIDLKKSPKTVHGVEVMKMKNEISDKYVAFDACEICFQIWTTEDNHRMRCCLPCGHIFGMSCILNWLQTCTHAHCFQCNAFFGIEDVRILYVNRLCIPTADDQMEDTRCFPYSKQGYTAFKQYIWGRLTHALNKRSDALKQRANVLGRQNVAVEWRTNLLKRKEYLERRAKALEQRADAIGRANALRRAGALRLRADALGQQADERLQKADEFGRQAKALHRQAKAFRRLVDTYGKVGSRAQETAKTTSSLADLVVPSQKVVSIGFLLKNTQRSAVQVDEDIGGELGSTVIVDGVKVLVDLVHTTCLMNVLIKLCLWSTEGANFKHLKARRALRALKALVKLGRLWRLGVVDWFGWDCAEVFEEPVGGGDWEYVVDCGSGQFAGGD